MVLESRGLPTTLTLSFKGDLKRETRFLAQYGQMLCTFFTALLVYQLDKNRGLRICEALWSAVIGATAVSTLIKRLCGRCRPRSPQAGKFLGPSWRHANYRESFPSSHTRVCGGVRRHSCIRISERGCYLLGIGPGVRRPAYFMDRALAQRRARRDCPRVCCRVDLVEDLFLGGFFK